MMKHHAVSSCRPVSHRVPLVRIPRPTSSRCCVSSRESPPLELQTRQPAEHIPNNMAVARRTALLMGASLLHSGSALLGEALAEESPGGIAITSNEDGFGTHPAAPGDLVLFHYVGTLEATGQVFDSTRGGLMYRDGGLGVNRPAAVQLGGGPVPGLCKGLRMGLEGMRVGGKRTFTVPAALGFGNQLVGAPYALIPANSNLRYEVELLRLSARGPDELTKIWYIGCTSDVLYGPHSAH